MIFKLTILTDAHKKKKHVLQKKKKRGKITALRPIYKYQEKTKPTLFFLRVKVFVSPSVHIHPLLEWRPLCMTSTSP